ncbi:ribonuclease H-like domain-containing protein [Tanacetum coccineum]
MADGNLVSINTIIQGATLTLLNQPFKIDLMPIKLGSFDVVIGMDWLSKYHARIICDEKVVHIPINGVGNQVLLQVYTTDGVSNVIEDLVLLEKIEEYRLIGLDLSRLATTLNRLERSYQFWGQQVVSGEDEFHDDNPPPLPPLVTPIQQAPHTLSTIKLPILKKGKYGIWAMKMEHYLGHYDYLFGKVLQKGNGPVQVQQIQMGQIRIDLLAKFHKNGTDANERWEATNQICGLYLLGVPSILIIRTKPGVDTLSFDDLYNNLRVFESDVKGSTASSSSTQNVAFVSSESTSSTNDVSTIYGVSTSSDHNSQREGSSSYTDELTYSFFTNQLSSPQLDHENLEQVDEFDLEEMDLKWQVAIISMRLNKFYKKTGRKVHFDAKEPVGFDKTKVECFNYHNTGYFASECRSKGNQESRRRDAGNTGYKAKDMRMETTKTGGT